MTLLAPQARFWTRALLFGAAGACLAAAAAEWALRTSKLGAREGLGVFVDFGGGDIGLLPCARGQVAGAGDKVTMVYTDRRGRRSGEACADSGAGAVILGDEQVFGLGVEFEDSFAGRLGARNAGVPGYGVLDALALGRLPFTLKGVSTVVVVVDQANDWVEGVARIGERNEVRSGFLLAAGWRERPGAWVWKPPFSGSALAYTVAGREVARAPAGSPAWLLEPASLAATSDAFGAEILAFAELRPEVQVVPVWLPADLATSEARAAVSPLAQVEVAVALRPWEDTTLRDQFAAAVAPLPLVDLTESLRDPASFLPGEAELSATGHAAVAQQLAAVLHR